MKAYPRLVPALKNSLYWLCPGLAPMYTQSGARIRVNSSGTTSVEIHDIRKILEREFDRTPSPLLPTKESEMSSPEIEELARNLLDRKDFEKIMDADEIPLLDAAEKFAHEVTGVGEELDDPDGILKLAIWSLVRNAFIAGASWGAQHENRQSLLKSAQTKGSA